MSIDNSCKELLGLLKGHLAYLGFDGTKFHFGPEKISERDARARFKSWTVTHSQKVGELLLYKINDKKLGDAMISDALRSEPFEESSDNDIDPSSLWGTHAIYRALNNVPQYTTESQGTSAIDCPLVFVNIDSKRLMNLSEYNPITFLAERGLSRKDIASNKRLVTAKLVFEPYKSDFTWFQVDEFYSENKMHINVYNPPRWRKICEALDAKIPSDIQLLLENLFPIESERLWVLRWIKCAVLDRNQTYLTMFGPKGVGKTMFASLIGSLVGEEYYVNIDNSLFTEKFTSLIYRKRVSFLDESGLAEKSGGSYDIKEGVKRLMNNVYKVEGKGQDPFMAKNFCSSIMALNRESDLNISTDDRRFSVPQIGERDLKEVISSVVLSRWDKEWGADPTTSETLFELAAFGKYLLELDYGDWSPAEPLRGDAFKQVTRRSLAGWKKAIIRNIKEEAVPGWSLHLASVSRLKDEANNPVKAGLAAIEKFLDTYRESGVTVATIEVRVEKKSKSGVPTNSFQQNTYIVPTPEFVQNYCYRQTLLEQNITEDLL